MAEKQKPERKKGIRPPKTVRFEGLDGQPYSLTETEALFCHYYLGGSDDRVSALLNAGYKPKGYHSAGVMASQILKKPAVREYIRARLKDYGFDKADVDLEHLFLIKQYHDLSVKEKAIDKYRKMTGEYAPEKYEEVDKYDKLTDDELDDIIERKSRSRELRRIRESKGSKNNKKSV